MANRGPEVQRSGRVYRPVSPRPGKSLPAALLPRDDLGDDKMLIGLAYAGTDFSGTEASVVDIERCTFDAVRFSLCGLDRCTVVDSIFDRCDFANGRFDSGSLLKSSIADSRLTGMGWSNGLLRDVSWVGCRADLTRFRQMKFKTVVFRECNLQQADFQWADLRGVTFENCDLSGAQFANASMDSSVEFSGCDLFGVGGVGGMRGATVRGGDLTGLAASLAQHVGINLEL